MKILLTALNAQYIHTNPAVRCIRQYARDRGVEGIDLLELTVNHRADEILRRLVEKNSDIYVFSCYIWNVELVEIAAAELRKLRPEAVLLAGGPEVSCGGAAFLKRNPAFDGVLAGEGERAAAALFTAMQEGRDTRNCPGFVWRAGNDIIENPPPSPVDMDAVPKGYGDLAREEGRILYYESMRGCPFRCSYCLSPTHGKVRARSLGQVFAHLDSFLATRVRQVKFVDRTFNCDSARALAIWRHLAARDNGVTNFHFELAACLLTEEQILFLKSVRPGLFQFEIGVQSLHNKTLQAICRAQDRRKLESAVAALREADNIHLHLDLIAGLPFEDMDACIDSFNGVYAMRPHRLQLGFLKVLRGTEMERRAAEYGIAYRDRAPYEVLRTRWLAYEELCRLKDVEHVLDLYFNSGRFSSLLAYLCPLFPSPFAFYEALAGVYREAAARGPVGKTEQYELLASLMEGHGIAVDTHAQWLCRYDFVRNERPRKLPRWVKVDETSPLRREISAFIKGMAVPERDIHIERFPFDPRTGERKPVLLLFDYGRRDSQGRAACREIGMDKPGL